MLKKYSFLYLYVVLILIYLGLALIPSPDPAVISKYHLTTISYRLVDLAVVLPYIAIWLIAYYGYRRLHQYAGLIASSRDGKLVMRLSQGLMVLAYGLPLMAIISTWLSLLERHDIISVGVGTIIHNYADLIIPVIAFFVMSGAARGLADLAKQRPSQRAIHVLIVSFIIIGLNYCYLVLRNNYLLAGVKVLTNKVYYMSDWLVIMTLVAPYLYAWFLGFLAAYEVYLYSQKASGIIYRRAWNWLTAGLLAVISSSIAVQYLTTMAERFARLRLSGLLVAIYLLLLVMAAGYVLIAVGSKQLRRIEEV